MSETIDANPQLNNPPQPAATRRNPSSPRGPHDARARMSPVDFSDDSDSPGLPPSLTAQLAEPELRAVDAELDAVENRIREHIRQAWRDALAEISERARLLRVIRAMPPPKCGACTRSGRPCEAPAYREPRALFARNGRCRLHGGLSTGPRTLAGRARCAASGRLNIEQLHARHRAGLSRTEQDRANVQMRAETRREAPSLRGK